jgi:membrane protease YdiL (CAAX protease family)
MSRAVAAAGAAPAKSAPRQAKGYFQRSELPLMSLALVLPFLIIYELGTSYFASDPIRHSEQRIIAFDLLQQFFHLFGASGRYLPALTVVGVLLSWHIARGDAWQIDLKHLLGMLIESAVLAIPLILLGFAAARYLPLMSWHRPASSMLVLSVGAGIYEELVFRLIAFTALSFFFIDVLEIRRGWGNLLIVFLSSFLFSLYHYLGNETFHVRSFAFRTLAGFYFGAVFAFRGFGITAGSHATYDLIVVLLRCAA